MLACDVQERAETIDFLFERVATGAGELVVTTARIADVRRGFHVHYPTRFHQPLQRAIDRAGAEPELTVGLTLDVFENRVAMPLAAGEREQHMQNGGRERRHITVTCISVTVILVKQVQAVRYLGVRLKFKMVSPARITFDDFDSYPSFDATIETWPDWTEMM
jgi:hypothetical protein